MNVLSPIRKEQILAALVEGNSIRSIERMTGTHRDTIMRLLVRVGNGCEKLLDENCKDINSNQIQIDEIWTYVGKKEKKLSEREKAKAVLGDQYVFVALDAETKLVPAFTVGKRNMETTLQFISTLKEKLTGRIQLTSDGFNPYIAAVETSFGADVDYAQMIKVYTSGPSKYVQVSEMLTKIITGKPNTKKISTAHIERQNLTMRMCMRRLTRLTNAFSKKLENLKAALALHFAYYNFMRIHSSIRVTPAMEAGIANTVWGWEDILERID